MFGSRKSLPAPSLAAVSYPSAEGSGSIVAWTDGALFEKARVRVAFTQRTGGVSMAPYDSLNLATHVDDELRAVQANRRILAQALELGETPVVVPKQVHGDRIVSLAQASAQSVASFREEAAKGCDALLVQARGVAGLMCFADCVPLVMVAPSGRFAVVHAGWRGVENGIAVKALHKLVLGEPGLTTDASCVNVYRGAYIHAECFEVDPDLRDMFVDRFGAQVAPDQTHVDLGRALDIDLVRAGIDPARIADVGRCTACDTASWFSYRAEKGLCGRHGALCVAL